MKQPKRKNQTAKPTTEKAKRLKAHRIVKKAAKDLTKLRVAKPSKKTLVKIPLVAEVKKAAPVVLVTPKAGVTVLPSDLTQAMNGVRRAVAKRSTLPVLGYVLIEAHAGDKFLKVTATNLELGVWRYARAAVKDNVALAIPTPVMPLVQSLADEPMTLTVQPKVQTMQLKQTGFTATLKGIDAKEFPEIPTQPKTPTQFEFTREQLAEIVARVLPCVATDESRPVLTSVFVNVIPGSGKTRDVEFAAADGFRLAKLTLHIPTTIGKVTPIKPAKVKSAKANKKAAPTNAPPKPKVAVYEFACLIPPAFLIEALKIAKEGTPLVIEVGQGTQNEYVTCANANGGVTSNTLDGNAPDYTRIIPEADKCKIMPLPLALIRAALDGAKVYSSLALGTVRLGREGKHVTARASSAELGDFNQQIPVQFGDTGPQDGFEIGINLGYLEQALKSAAWQDGQLPLEMLVQTPNSPMMLHKGKQFCSVIMPMQLDVKEPVHAKPPKQFTPVEEPTDPEDQGRVDQAVAAANGMAEENPLDMDELKFEAWAKVIAAHEPQRAGDVARLRERRAEAAEVLEHEEQPTPKAVKADPAKDVATVFAVNCSQCGSVNKVREGNSAVCQCGAIIDDQGAVIFAQDPEPVAA